MVFETVLTGWLDAILATRAGLCALEAQRPCPSNMSAHFSCTGHFISEPGKVSVRHERYFSMISQ
jgi:hypothetical protein